MSQNRSFLGPVGRTFVHHARRAVGERTVDEIRVPGHPADVGRAPEDIVFLEIEDHSGRGCDAGEIAAGRVHDALWLAGGPRCVEDVQHVLRVHRLRLAVERRVLHETVPPVVATLPHFRERFVSRSAGATLHHHHVLDRRSRLQRFVGIALQGNYLAAAIAGVRGDEHLHLGIVDPVAQRFGGEPAEHDRVDGADARAGEHRDRRFRYERQVDRHAIPFANPQLLEDVGELRHLAVKIPVRERPPVTRLSFPDERRLVSPRSPDVAVHAVGGDVELSAGKPFRVGRLPLENLLPRLDPLQLARLLGPELLGVALGFVVDVGRRDVGRAPELRRRLELPGFR